MTADNNDVDTNNEVFIATRSAFDSLPQLKSQLFTKRCCILLDYDGTLTPIVSKPSDARISSAMRSRVEELSRLFPTAIVTGRSIESISDFLQLPHLHYATSHGFDIRAPGYTKLKSVADDFVPQLQSCRDLIQQRCQSIKGSLVEDNHYSISVHYRNCSDEDARLIEQHVNEAIATYTGTLQKLCGKMVYEVRPHIDWHKGEAVRFLLQHMTDNASHDSIVPICLGDDRTDEDAFRVLSAYPHSITVLVRPADKPRQTAANYTLNSVVQVGEFLQQLIEIGQQCANNTVQRVRYS